MADVGIDTTAAKKPGPPLILCIVVIVIGAVVGIWGLAVGVSRAVHSIDGPSGNTPADFHTHLTSGGWKIYVDTGESAGLSGSYPDDHQLGHVVVTGPTGARVPTREILGDSTLTINGRIYQAEVGFTIPTSGDYDVKVHSDTPGLQLHVKLSKNLSDVAKGSVTWFALMSLGLLIGALGLVGLIVGIVRRRRASRGPPTVGYAGAAGTFAAAQPGPGWYPDPAAPGSVRYWDGARWTDHTQPQ